MLDALKSYFKPECQFGHMAALLQNLGNVMQIVKTDFMLTVEAKNAAIDAICQIIKENKEPVQKEQKAPPQ
jgi:hypothetical protein